MKLAVSSEVSVEVIESSEHDFLLSTEDVSFGYGVKPSSVRSQKSTNKDDFILGKHFVIEKNDRNREKIMWTRKGVVRLGFFIKSKEARVFRDWAEDYITSNKPLLIDGKDPMAIIRGLKSQLAQHIKKIELQNKNIDELLEQNATLALPAPSVDVEPYKEEIGRLNAEKNKEHELKEHFSDMAGNLLGTVKSFKNAPKLIKKEMGNFLNHPEVYKMLGALSLGLENEMKKVLGVSR